MRFGRSDWSWGWIGSWGLILLPLAFYLWCLPRFGTLQNNDYYQVLGQVTDGGEFSSRIVDWWRVSANEHRATVPALIYALNVVFNHGNNRALTLFSLVAMSAIFWMLYCQLPAAIRNQHGPRAVFGLTLASLVFSPVAVHCIAMGFSGTQWLLAGALSILSFLIFLRHGPGRSPVELWPLLPVGVVGSLTYTTHLSVWPAMFSGALCLRLSWRHLLTLAILGGGLGVMFFTSYQTPDHMVEPSRDPLRVLAFFTAYMGSIFTRDLELARALGALGTVAAVVLHGWILWRATAAVRREAVLWGMLQVWALVNAVGTAMSRAEGREVHALASRYTTVSGLFWVGLLITIGLLGTRAARSRRQSLQLAIAVGLTLAAGCSILATYRRGLPEVANFIARASHQRMVALSMVRGYYDRQWTSRYVSVSPPWVFRVEAFLKAKDHVPFDHDWPAPSSRHVAARFIVGEPSRQVRGWLDGVYALDSGEVLRVWGWAVSRATPISEIVLLDRAGWTQGEMVFGLDHQQLEERLGSAAFSAGWGGYVEAGLLREGIRAYVRLEGDPRYFPLRIPENLVAGSADVS